MYAGLPDIMIPLPGVATLQSLQPDMEAISAITKKHDPVSFHVFAFGDDGYIAYVRDFAPHTNHNGNLWQAEKIQQNKKATIVAFLVAQLGLEPRFKV